jgi:hypothetical protein
MVNTSNENQDGAAKFASAVRGISFKEPHVSILLSENEQHAPENSAQLLALMISSWRRTCYPLVKDDANAGTRMSTERAFELLKLGKVQAPHKLSLRNARNNFRMCANRHMVEWSARAEMNSRNCKGLAIGTIQVDDLWSLHELRELEAAYTTVCIHKGLAMPDAAPNAPPSDEFLAVEYMGDALRLKRQRVRLLLRTQFALMTLNPALVQQKQYRGFRQLVDVLQTEPAPSKAQDPNGFIHLGQWKQLQDACQLMDLLCVQNPNESTKHENIHAFIKAKGLPALGKLMRRCLDLRGGFKKGGRAFSAAMQKTPTPTSLLEDNLSKVAGTVELLVLKMVTAAGFQSDGQSAAADYTELSAELLPRLIALDQTSAIQASALRCICALSASETMQKQLTDAGTLWRLLLSITAEPVAEECIQTRRRLASAGTSQDDAIEAVLVASVKPDPKPRDIKVEHRPKSSMTSKMMAVTNAISGKKVPTKEAKPVRKREKTRRQWAAEALGRVGGYVPVSEEQPEKSKNNTVQAILKVLLPSKFVEALGETHVNPDEFLGSISRDWEQPMIVWNKEMVHEMEGLCKRQLRNLELKRYNPETIERDMQRFSYTQLVTELRLGHVFVRVFNKMPDTPDINDTNFCGALLNHLFFAWSAPLDRKPIVEESFQIGSSGKAVAMANQQDNSFSFQQMQLIVGSTVGKGVNAEKLPAFDSFGMSNPMVNSPEMRGGMVPRTASGTPTMNSKSFASIDQSHAFTVQRKKKLGRVFQETLELNLKEGTLNVFKLGAGDSQDFERAAADNTAETSSKDGNAKAPKSYLVSSLSDVQPGPANSTGMQFSVNSSPLDISFSGSNPLGQPALNGGGGSGSSPKSDIGSTRPGGKVKVVEVTFKTPEAKVFFCQVLYFMATALSSNADILTGFGKALSPALWSPEDSSGDLTADVATAVARRDTVFPDREVDGVVSYGDGLESGANEEENREALGQHQDRTNSGSRAAQRHGEIVLVLQALHGLVARSKDDLGLKISNFILESKKFPLIFPYLNDGRDLRRTDQGQIKEPAKVAEGGKNFFGNAKARKSKMEQAQRAQEMAQAEAEKKATENTKALCDELIEECGLALMVIRGIALYGKQCVYGLVKMGTMKHVFPLAISPYRAPDTSKAQSGSPPLRVDSLKLLQTILQSSTQAIAELWTLGGGIQLSHIYACSVAGVNTAPSADSVGPRYNSIPENRKLEFVDVEEGSDASEGSFNSGEKGSPPQPPLR